MPVLSYGARALLAACAVSCFGSYTAPAVTVEAEPSGIRCTVSAEGRWLVSVRGLAWRFRGRVPAPQEVWATSGADGNGPYREIVFQYTSAGPRVGAIRAYEERSAVLFSVTSVAAAPNSDPFPVFQEYPRDLRHLSFTGLFPGRDFSGLDPESPWAFFDDSGNTFILSAASNFATARLAGGPPGDLTSGIVAAAAILPAGFRHQTLLAFGAGIGQTFRAWGSTLANLSGKPASRDEGDVTLTHLGYWTDNGAAYYYRYEPGLGYPGTLLAIRDEFARKGMPLGYLQLDSWFYPKGPGADWAAFSGGIYNYEAAPALFPERLQGFQNRLRLPLVTHARWIDPASPYRRQYRMSGNVSVDPLFWQQVATYLKTSGAAVFEQDWLATNAQPERNLADPDAFFSSMAQALHEAELSIQYCMPLPRHFLESTRYPAVRTIRVSADRFTRERWEDFLYGSLFASAVGLRPFSDVLRSSEMENLLLASLSAGPVGLGDALGTVDVANLARVARADGVLVKPDEPAVPIDEAILAEAQGVQDPIVAAASTNFEGYRASYVVILPSTERRVAKFRPASLGYTGPVYVYDWFGGAGAIAKPDEWIQAELDSALRYFVVAPLAPAGIALVGDEGHFASLGRQRVAAAATGSGLAVRVLFAPGERLRVLHGYAPAAPHVRATAGAVERLDYDAATGRFRLAVSAGAEGFAELALSAAPGSPDLPAPQPR